MKLKFFYTDGGFFSNSRQVLLSAASIRGDTDEMARYQNYFLASILMLTDNAGDCERILKEIDMIESGVKNSLVVGLNDTEVVISRNEIQVNIYLDDKWVGQPEGRFPLAQFTVAIIARRAFFLMPEALSNVIEINV